MKKVFETMNDQIIPGAELNGKVMEAASAPKTVRTRRPLMAMAAVLVLIMVAAIPLATFADEYIPLVREFFGVVLKEEIVDGIVKTQEGVDSEGNPWAAVESPIGQMPDWLKVEGDRVYFVANGENLDITDEISLDEPFVYQYTDLKGITHYMAVGRHRTGLGWLKHRRSAFAAEGKYSGWIRNGDYGHGYWDIETQDFLGWYMKAYEELGIPWMNPHKEYYDYDPDTWGE